MLFRCLPSRCVTIRNLFQLINFNFSENSRTRKVYEINLVLIETC